MTAIRYAWCFDHGRTHRFPAGQEPWCTALWVWLAGDTETAAMDDKTARYGEARFITQLPLEQRVAIIENSEEAQSAPPAARHEAVAEPLAPLADTIHHTLTHTPVRLDCDGIANLTAALTVAVAQHLGLLNQETAQQRET